MPHRQHPPVPALAARALAAALTGALLLPLAAWAAQADTPAALLNTSPATPDGPIASQPSFEDIFKAVDTDRDGVLSPAEAKSLPGNYDTDKDGNVSLQEFLNVNKAKAAAN